MCAECLCVHNKDRHGRETVHVAQRTREKLKAATAFANEAASGNEELDRYAREESKRLRRKGSVEKQIIERLQIISQYCAEQQELLAKQNDTLEKSHNAIKEEIRNCRDKIKAEVQTQKHVERKLKRMMDEKQYWVAYEAAKKDVKIKPQLQYDGIKDRINAFQENLGEYEKLLASLDVKILPATKIQTYEESVKANADLLTQIENANSTYSDTSAYRSDERYE